jgi:hypothetical protein
LLGGASIIVLDNVTAIRSPNLAVALRTTSWRGRVLGRSQMVTLPNTATWIATGNNPELSDEIARRAVPIRLDCGLEHPEERATFTHRLPEWALEHRAELVSACLSLVQAYLEAGRPRSTQTLGGFESWASVMGGLLDVAGVPGLLANREALRARTDRESTEWLAFCHAWWQRFGDRPATAGELFKVAAAGRLLLDVWAGRSQLSAAQRFGRALAGHRDQIHGVYRIRYAGEDSRTHNASWRLERPATSAPTPETTETPPDEPAATGVWGVSGVGAPTPIRAPTAHSDDGEMDGDHQRNAGWSRDSGQRPDSAAFGFDEASLDDWDEV